MNAAAGGQGLEQADLDRKQQRLDDLDAGQVLGLGRTEQAVPDRPAERPGQDGVINAVLEEKYTNFIETSADTLEERSISLLQAGRELVWIVQRAF